MFTPIWLSTTDLKMTVSKYFGKTNSELYDNWTNYHDEIINGIKCDNKQSPRKIELIGNLKIFFDFNK